MLERFFVFQYYHLRHILLYIEVHQLVYKIH